MVYPREHMHIASGFSHVRASCVLALLALAAAACGSTPPPDSGGNRLIASMEQPAYVKACAETPGCRQPDSAAPAAAEGIWRVLVARPASGEIRIDRVELVDVPEGDGVPVGHLTGEHALVGLDAGGTAVDGQPIRFPDTMRIEYAGGQRPVERIDLAGREVDVVVYVRALPSIASLAVLDSSGTVVASAPAQALLAARLATLAPASAGLPGTDPAKRWPWSGLPGHCSHIVVLQGEADRHLAKGISFGPRVQLVLPGPWQLATTQGALERMTPLLCQGIGRIAYGRVERETSIEGGVNSVGAGDLILINVGADFGERTLEEALSRRLFMQRTIIHEAAHTAETLLTSEGVRAGQYGGMWGLAPRTLAQRTIENVRLAKGLEDEWVRMHQSFVSQGWASGYPSWLDDGAERPGWSAQQIAEGGFMSQYGSQAWWDDIAEFVAHAYIGPELAAGIQRAGISNDLREDGACREMQGHDEDDVPSRLAAVYAKLLFLRDLGLVTQEGVDACTGPNLGLSSSEPGFHFSQGSMRLRKFLNGVEAGIGTKGGGKRVFTMKGNGQVVVGDGTYPASLELRLDLGGRFDSLDEVSWPRGVYELGLFGDDNLMLRVEDAPNGNFDAMDGFVLVAESSNKRIAGSIFLRQAFRMQAPLPVPQVFDPPLNIRFLIQRGQP